MKIRTPEITETAPGSGEFIIANGGQWVLPPDVPLSVLCSLCNEHPTPVHESLDPWASVPQGGKRADAYFCPLCCAQRKVSMEKP